MVSCRFPGFSLDVSQIGSILWYTLVEYLQLHRVNKSKAELGGSRWNWVEVFGTGWNYLFLDHPTSADIPQYSTKCQYSLEI